MQFDNVSRFHFPDIKTKTKKISFRYANQTGKKIFEENLQTTLGRRLFRYNFSQFIAHVVGKQTKIYFLQGDKKKNENPDINGHNVVTSKSLFVKMVFQSIRNSDGETQIRDICLVV